MSDDIRPADLPPDLVRGLFSPRVSRRALLRGGGAGALAAALAACGVSGAAKPQPSGSAAVSSAAKAKQDFWSQQHKTGSFRFANWPLYIDVSDKNKNDHPSIDLFTKDTGIKVSKYSEGIQDSGSYFSKIQPVLASGQGTGFDLMVITNGVYLDKLIQLGYLIPLDQARMTNFRANASSLVKNPSFDRGNVYTMAWQSGITGIGYDPKRVGHKITSWADLQDPKLKGKIGMFGDTEDMPSAALLAVGVNPEKSTEADWRKAAAWLKKQQPLVRKYYEQDYIDPLSKGDIWASMAWSGDIFQANANGANLEFVVPREGGVIWTDNMCIPKHAQHPLDAMTYMDFVYRPEVAAMLAESINYITPVPGCAPYIRKDAAALKGSAKADMLSLASDPLIFPKQQEYSRLHRYRVLTPAEEKTFNAIFEPIFQS